LKTIAIVAAKPFVVNAVLPTIMPDHAEHRIVIVPYWIWGMFRKFAMPRGLRMSDMPYTGTPHWMHWDMPDMSVAYERNGDGRIPLEMSQFEALATADEIICMTDASPVEAHSAAMLMAHAFGMSMIGDDYASLERIGEPNAKEPLPFPEVRYLPLDSLKAEDVKRNWMRGLTTHSPEFLDLVKQQCCIRFFNIAFQVNSRMILDSILRDLNPAYEGGMIIKSSLQILYVIADNCGMSMDRLKRVMIEWKGTGRHPDVPIGELANRHQAVENLANAGLIRIKNDMYTVSPVGASFLAALHKDCRDVDQFARLDAWARQWPASRPAVEKYLRTFFGKQKRLNGRSSD